MAEIMVELLSLGVALHAVSDGNDVLAFPHPLSLI